MIQNKFWVSEVLPLRGLIFKDRSVTNVGEKGQATIFGVCLADFGIKIISLSI